jgi:hypothetical protein
MLSISVDLCVDEMPPKIRAKGEPNMKYMLLIYGNESTWASMSQDDRQKLYAEHRAYGEAMTKAGVIRGGSELKPSSNATTLRFKSGKTTTLDGPFAESKEQLAGYYIIEADNLETALEWAAKTPGMTSGAVEVRPMAPGPEMNG